MTRLDRMLGACAGEPVDRPPVWLMRQAGRYLPEYREVRSRVGFLELCRDPELAAEVSIQPFRRFGTDAIIVFSDILLPLAGLGLDFEFSPGPVVRNPLERPSDLDRIEGDLEETLAPTCEAIRGIRREVGPDVPIIGFAGGPWTLAAYSTEERLSRDTLRVRTLMHTEPAFLDRMLERLAEVTAESLRRQAEAGANVLQVFDTWAGLLAPETFRRFAGRALAQVVESLSDLGVPLILFARGAGHLLDELAALAPSVVSIDWRLDLAHAASRVGQAVSLQGNLDPVALHAGPDQVRRLVRELVNAGAKARGHIVNLGHGVYPTTPIEGVSAFVEAVQEIGEGQ
ncbi:MAG: uroporphyrinogen decarboxylase [Myxococcota bacterium]